MSESDYTVEYLTESESYPKQTREMGIAAEGVIQGMLQAAADGKVEVTEVLGVITGNVEKFMAAAKDADQVDDEHRADPGGCIGAWTRTVDKIQRSVFEYVKARKAAKAAAAGS